MFNSPISRNDRQKASTITKFMGDPSNSSDGDIWYDVLTGQLRANIGGVLTTINQTPNGGALQFLGQQVASSSASLDFTSFISSTYDEYVFEFINIIPATDGALLWMRMNTGSGFDTGANYSYRYWRMAGATAVVNATGATKIILTDGVGNVATYGICDYIKLFSPQNTSLRKEVSGRLSFQQTAAGGYEASITMGAYDITTALTGVQFLFSTGNIASGTIRVYGVSKTASVGTAPAQGLTLIQEQILTGAAATIDFQNIPATYRHLLVVWSGQDTAAGTSTSDVRVKVNNDGTSGNYTNTARIGASGAASFASENAPTALGLQVGQIPNAGNTSIPGTGQILFPDYRGTTFHKKIMGFHGDEFSSGLQVWTFDARWKSATAINRLTFGTAGTAFATGTVFSLYGMAAIAGPIVYNSPILAVNTNPGTTGTVSTTSANFADVDATNLVVTFVAPPSGKVLVRLSGYGDISTNAQQYFWGLRSGSTFVTNSGIGPVRETDGSIWSGAVQITGLVPGQSYTWKWAHAVTGGATGRMLLGPVVVEPVTTSLHMPPCMEVWALP